MSTNDIELFGNNAKAKQKSSISKASTPGMMTVNNNADEVPYGKENAKDKRSRGSTSRKSSKGRSSVAASEEDGYGRLDTEASDMIIGRPPKPKRSSEKDAEESAANIARMKKCIILVFVAVAAAIGATVWIMSRTATLASASGRSEVGVILAGYGPLDEETMTWLTQTSTWEPNKDDPNSSYLWLERYVMGLLYISTSGPTWTENTNWLSSEPVCKWHNKGTNLCSGPMTRLDLNDNGLQGYLPPIISQLTALTEIVLRGNQLTASIPSSIGDLSNLETLNLASNQLTGSIPSSIGDLSNLETLNVASNQLTGSIPSSIVDLNNLETLNVAWNQLAGSIPSSIGILSNLETLKLSWNQLTGRIPSSIGNLSNLETLNLTWNQLTGSIPASIFNLSNLGFLYFYRNQLTGNIPESVGKLSNLQSLNLSDNQLTGSVPASIGEFSSLRRLNLRGNKLIGSIPAPIGNLSNLAFLYLDDNQLSGAVPVLLNNLVDCFIYNNCFEDVDNAESVCNVSPNCS